MSRKSTNRISVTLRIRPLTKNEIQQDDTEVDMTISQEENENNGLNLYKVTILKPKTAADDVEFVEVLGGFKIPKSKPKREKKYMGFQYILTKEKNNQDVYTTSIAPLIQETLDGKTSCAFAYGHTSSGKTHTMLGYEGKDIGVYRLAGQQLLQAIALEQTSSPLIIQVRFIEVYNQYVYDLLNGNAKCFVRQDMKGKVQVRGETTTDENGDVHSPFSKVAIVQNMSELVDVVEQGLQARKTGNSNLHEHSSRSHAILELEIVSPELVALRERVTELEVKLVSLGHQRDNLKLVIFWRENEQIEGKTVRRLNAKGATAEECELMLELDRDYAKTERDIADAMDDVEKFMTQCAKSVGGKLVFIDLAGSEHAGSVHDGIQKTETEQQECREINKSLSALKACFTSLAEGRSSRSCFRQSTLTQLLRDHLVSEDCKTAMIANLSPSVLHLDKTIPTLQYAEAVSQI